MRDKYDKSKYTSARHARLGKAKEAREKKAAAKKAAAKPAAKRPSMKETKGAIKTGSQGRTSGRTKRTTKPASSGNQMTRGSGRRLVEYDEPKNAMPSRNRTRKGFLEGLGFAPKKPRSRRN